MERRPFVCLVVLDGWAIGPDYPGNAIRAAHTPVMDRLQADYPMTTLRCWGLDVGLPDDQMGNSEVGHLNLGAGRIVYQLITRIDLAIEDGSFFRNEAFLRAIERARQPGRTLHLMGLIGDGGVHSHQRHLHALLELAARSGVPRVAVHAFTDGRDTAPTSAIEHMRQLLATMERLRTGFVATVSGRYYAMDRDKRWERTKLAYDALVCGHGRTARSPLEAIERSYAENVTDEFIVPTVIVDTEGQPLAPIRDGDALIFFNFRADRARQLTLALTDPDFSAFERCAWPRELLMVTMAEYEPHFPVLVAFSPDIVRTPLARVLSEAGLRQFHTAETEKYAHVTYFFNGGREEPFPGEDRVLVPSPKVPTYDLKPEMSAPEVTDVAVEAILSGKYAFVLVNYANPDMVGHTGVFAAAVKAVECVDACLGRIEGAVRALDGYLVVTADHGNADEMLIPGTDEVWTAHTKNPVPFVLVAPESSRFRHVALRQGGRLADVAPTILELMGLPQPDEMTGRSLVHADG
ncbi:MAG: 2,3-bisphosphoglycerate-independent phosphoglycerate mutase [Thermomicrobium sp.]|nr:2,3-bisphosphoglycerate-independent phosphoglycerate mutase [Thermomicrobium sp.]MDW8059195.1 2,3-bisphosphoglycerate-independent phosphoglycerate mutase [Thermomicrobium sp.]